MVGHRRSRSWCPARTGPNPCCCRRSVLPHRPSPRASGTASRTSARPTGASTKAGTPSQRQLDQLVDQIGIAQPGGRPHPGVHRKRGEAGHGVDLVDDHIPVLGVEAVRPGQTLATGCLERSRGNTAYLVGHMLGHVCGAGELDIELRQVLGLEVVEVMTPDDLDLYDLTGSGGSSVAALQDATL